MTNAKETVTLVIDDLTLEKMREFYEDDIYRNKDPKITLYVEYEDLRISVYSGKVIGRYSAVFSGSTAKKESLLWGLTVKDRGIKEKGWLDFSSQYGSDEVGTGDFFGPVCVVATFLNDDDVIYIDKLGIKDSKKMSDARIKQLAPLLIKRVKYSLLTVPPKKYNELSGQGFNANKIKAWLHQQALGNLVKKYGDYPIYMDQFTTPASYERFVSDHEVKLPPITFKKKGETHYPSVAVASVIARYAFLQKMEQLNKKYKTTFPLGANEKVVKFARNLSQKIRPTQFVDLVKMSFKTYAEIFNEEL